MTRSARLRSAYSRTCPSLLLAAVALASACSKQEHPPVATRHGKNDPVRCAGAATTVDPEDEPAPEVTCEAGKRRAMCVGEWSAECDGEGEPEKLVNCRADEQVCVPKKCSAEGKCSGCRACRPGEVRCDADGGRAFCRDDGSGFDQAEPCDTTLGLFCNPLSGACDDLCKSAEEARTYIGCEYWALATSNSQLALLEQDDAGICKPFTFAAVIANPQAVTATVRVESPGQEPRSIEVEPGRVATIELPCSLELKGHVLEQNYTVQTGRAAHHIVSNVPVTVYQFNPLEFKAEVEIEGELGDVYSYTNDASLLLPVHSLGSDYVVLTQPTLEHEIEDTVGDEPTERVSGPGFVAIVGVDDEPTSVEITSSAFTQPSEDGGIPAVEPGQTLDLSLHKGEVIQLISATPDDCPSEHSDTARGVEIHYCDVPPEYDLTGTRIHAQGRVSVIAGHDCVFLPHYRWACDHIEESLLPVEAWGKDVLIGVSEAVKCQDTVPNMARVVAAADETRVNFAPEVHEPVVLNAGEYVEFEFTQDFRASASKAIMVGQFLLGQDYEGIGKAGSFAKGDPSMSLGIPVEQWRREYEFLTPETYPDNYINVMAREGQFVQLDGGLVQGFYAIEGTRMQIARVRVEPGQHRLTSPGGVGLVLYGYATYTSYMLPGGLDLNIINGPL